MPSPAVGIIVSLSIITALGLAVIENPQIQAWLEEQRQRIAELLRSIGQELDPESRRAAEAFAFEGRTPGNDVGLRREMSGSQDAAAVATGRSMSNAGSIRRIPIRGPSDPDEAEERRRKGREYLARRNQEMYEMQQKRKEKAKEDGDVTPPSPTSFDAMVDDEGKLRLVDNEVNELPNPPTSVPILEKFQTAMAEVEHNLAQPILIDESSSSTSAWRAGSRVANPFDDEYAMDLDRSMTPKPPVPPKIALEELPPRAAVEAEAEDEAQPSSRMPGSFTPRIDRPRIAQVAAESGRSDMTYEEQEQLAIALSLSEAERRASEDAERRRSQAEDEDAELRAAILASLRDQQAASAPVPAHPAPLIDITESTTAASTQQSLRRGHWETLFNQDYSPAQEPLSAVPRSIASEDEDELYSVTPQLTRARLVSLNEQAPTQLVTSSPSPYDPVREAAASHTYAQPVMMEESFYSAASPARSQTLSPSPLPPASEDHQLIDTTIPAPATPSTLPASRFQSSDSDSGSETWASASPAPSRTAISVAVSEDADEDVEVLDITGEEDSDVDMLEDFGGEDGRRAGGTRTPDSWTEVGSWDGESEEGSREGGVREV